MRRKYGAEVIDKVYQEIGFFTSFDSVIKKVTGKNLQTVYQDTNQELKALWTEQLRDLKITPVQRLNQRSTEPIYTHYSYPQAWGKYMVALKRGLATPPQFVVLDKQGKEQVLLKLGNIKEEAGFSLAQSKLVWIEQVPDLRWPDQDYSVIQLYDLQAKKLKTLTTKSRYAAAALSPDASKIVALESDPAYNHQLVILDSEQGNVLQRLPNPANHYYFNPTFSPDGQYIVAIKQADHQATVTLIHIETGTIQELIPPTTENIGWPVMAGNYVFYNSSYNGIDNIYALDLTTRKRYQVTSRKYGAYYAAIQEGHTLLCNDFTKDGMDIVQLPVDPQQWTPLEEVAVRAVNYYEPLVEQENNPDLLKTIPQETYAVESFYPWKPRPHLQVQLTCPPFDKYPGVKFILQDWLKTAAWTLFGYKAKPRGGSGYFLGDLLRANHDIYTKFAYKKWFLIPKIGFHLKFRRDSQYKTFKSKVVDLGLKLPLTWMHGPYLHRLTLKTVTSRVQEPAETAYLQTHKVHFERSSKKSPRDMYSPWAQNLATIYRHSLYGGAQHQLYATKAAFYFPGLANHHSLRLSVGHQYRASTTADYMPELCTRGHEAYIMSKVQELYHTSLDYTLPLAYPDWELGSWLLVNRLSTNLFHDWGYLPHSNSHLQTVGIDFLMSITIFDLGIRYLHKIEKREWELGPLLICNFIFPSEDA